MPLAGESISGAQMRRADDGDAPRRLIEYLLRNENDA